GEGHLGRVLLTLAAVAVLVLLLVLPLALVLAQALAGGLDAYGHALVTRDALSSIRLTLIVAVISVPLNTLFGVIAAWCIAKFEFPGRNLLTTFIDLPFSVSPVIAGLVFVLVFGAQGWLGPL